MTTVNPLIQAAISAYNNVSKNTPSTPAEAVQFQNMVKVNFNKFADMTPSQILSHITDARSNAMRPDIIDRVNIASGAGIIGQSLRKQEDVVRRSLTGNASLQDVMAATNEASNVIKTATALRSKLFDAMDKIMNMQI